MKFLITGDLVVSQDYDVEKNIDKSIVDMFKTSEFNIVNLEAPVTKKNCKILKTGPYLKSNKVSTLNVFSKLNINIATLANNHIKDYEEKGVLDTIEFCEANNVQPIGAGRNLEIASRTKILHTSEGRVALINIAENEWSSAGKNSAGANGMNIFKDIKKIQQAKKDNDYVFVIIHGGHEYYNLPSPRMKEQYRFYAEHGADLVVGHHTHCINGYEIYKGVPIYYSLGNFLFTKSSIKPDWYIGLILEVNVRNGKLKTSLHPTACDQKSFKLSLLSGEEKDKIEERIESYSKTIKDADELEDNWQKFILSKQNIYTDYWSPLSFIDSKYLKGLIRRLKIKLTNKEGHALYLNLMRCEAHYDISKEILEKKLVVNHKV